MAALFFTEIITFNKHRLSGPVSLSEDGVYHFRNTFSDLDFYFLLKKSFDDRWYFAGGPSHQVDQELIDAVGSQIDDYNLANN